MIDRRIEESTALFIDESRQNLAGELACAVEKGALVSGLVGQRQPPRDAAVVFEQSGNRRVPGERIYIGVFAPGRPEAADIFEGGMKVHLTLPLLCSPLPLAGPGMGSNGRG